MPPDPTPVTALAGKEVFTADAARVGTVTDVVVDLERGGLVELALTDVAEETVGGLPDDASGVRVPFRLVRGVDDVIVLRTAAAEAALPLPGERSGDAASGAEASPGHADGGSAAGDDDPIV